MRFYAPFQISENISETPEGYLVCRGVSIGRIGEMEYGKGESPIKPGPDGKVIVTRAAEELFRPETIASFEGKPVTIRHPSDFVDPENWAALSKGLVQNVRRGDGSQGSDLVADLLITEARAIELVKGGLREVSCGYDAHYTETGVGRGFQHNIIGNHLALVEEGRAGTAYAINDHKGDGSMKKKITDQINAIFAKAQDEAMKVTDCMDATDAVPAATEKKEGFVTMTDMKGYFDEKFAAMGKKDEPAKDAGGEQDPQTGKPATPVAKDEAPDMAAVLAKIEERLAKLEGAKVGDEEGEEGEESEDDDFEESTMAGETGDSAGDDEDEEELASRVEILAPGMKPEGKDVKGKALLAAYGTTDGKAVIDQFTGGKSPDIKNQQVVDAVFVGASEILKNSRKPLASARRRTADAFSSVLNTPKGALTAEELNEKNAKHYGKK
jgi:hypothetical protein